MLDAVLHLLCQSHQDTDSIFVSSITNAEHDNNLPVPAFTAACKQNLGMEGKKRDRPPFFNQVFSQLIDDYKNNNKSGLIFNVLKAFKQLEAAEVNPSLLAYSVILNKDPDNYRSYTPQHKIGKSLNKEPGSLIKYYKTGQQEDGYKGYSTNYQDLDIDIYKIELWKLIKDVLALLDCDVKKLEDQIFPTIIEEDD